MEQKVKRETYALDAASVRTLDKDGYLHVATSHLTAAQVAPYYGYEIPRSKELGLDPERIYYGWRCPDELEKALRTFAEIPLLIEHKMDSSSEPQTGLRVGTIGSNPQWDGQFISNSLAVWDDEAKKAIMDGSLRDLSCGYWYVADFTPGKTPDGVDYDFVMRNIKCNHVALVAQGRAPDCYVEDSLPQGMEKAMEKENQGACDDFETVAKQMIEGKSLNLTPEQVDALAKLFVELHAQAHAEKPAEGTAAPVAGDEGAAPEEGAAPPAEGEKKAEDEDSACDEDKPADGGKPEEKPSGALDEDAITKRIEARLTEKFAAAEKVCPYAGKLDPLAFDSADGIYLEALKQMGVNAPANPASAKDVFEAITSYHPKASGSAMDSVPAKDHSDDVLRGYLDRFGD